jgi:hypothetical protein
MRFIQLVIAIIGVSIIISSFSEKALAQAAAASSSTEPKGHAASIHTGPLLPNSIPATDEILSGFGFRYGYPLFESTLLEAGYTGSNSEGVTYNNLHASLRGQVPFQDLFVYGLLGADLTRIKGSDSSDYTYYGGVHTAGGILAHVADTLFLRMEMRFNFHPGTILFFGFGFEYRFGSGGSSN